MTEAENEEYEKYVRLIKEIYPNWDDATIRKKIDEIQKETATPPSEAAKLYFVKVGGIYKQEESVTIEELIEGLSGIVYARILKISEPRDKIFSDGTIHKVCDVIVGDRTGSLRMSLWDERIDNISGMNRGDVLRLSGCIYSKNRLMCKSFERVEEGVKDIPPVDEIPLYPRRFLVSLARSFGQIGECRCQITGVYKTNYMFSACPSCGYSLSGTFCYKCREEVPEPSRKVKVPIVVDDGTLRLRGILWDQMLRKLVGKDVKLVDVCTADLSRAYRMLKELLLGKEILVRGYIIKSDFGFELRIIDADPITRFESELKFIQVTK